MFEHHQSLSRLRMIVACVTLSAAPARGESASYTVDQVFDAFRDRDNQISAWYIRYRSEPDDQGVSIRRRVAARRPDRISQWSAHCSKLLSPSDDPLRQRLLVCGSQEVVERPFIRWYWSETREPNDPLSGTGPQNIVFVAIGWWSLDEVDPPRFPSGVSMIPGRVKPSERSAYQVHAQQELCQGRLCHVVENEGVDKIWVDMASNAAILRREIYPGASRRQVVEAISGQYVNEKIWVPTTLSNTVFVDDDESGVTKKLHSAVLHLDEILLNDDVDESLFDFTPPPGSVTEKEDGLPYQAVPGGTELIEETADWIVKNCFDELPTVRANLNLRWLPWASAAITAVLSCLIVRRKS
jgi:hypothetical protein